MGVLLFLQAEAAPAQTPVPAPAAEVLGFDRLRYGRQSVSQYYQQMHQQMLLLYKKLCAGGGGLQPMA